MTLVTSKNFSLETWNEVEKNVKDYSLLTICKTINNPNKTKCVGDKIYRMTIRKYLYDIVEQMDQSEKQAERAYSNNDDSSYCHSLTLDIRHGLYKKIDNRASEIVSNFIELNGRMYYKSGLYSNFLELKCFTLMLMGNYVVGHNPFHKILSQNLGYKLIETFNYVIPKIPLQLITLVKDMNYVLDTIRQTFNYSRFISVSRFPYLQNKRELFCIVDNMEYDFSKIALLDNIMNTKNEIVCFYKVSDTSQKIKCIINLAKLSIRPLIYCCGTDLERIYMAKLLFNSDVQIAVATYDKKDEIKIINQTKCKNRQIIIADPHSTKKILEISSDYIVFLDNMLSDADIQGNITYSLINILNFRPTKTIVASNRLTNDIIHVFTSLLQIEHYKFIIEDDFAYGVNIYDKNGNHFLPHGGCIDVISLTRVLNRLIEKPKLLRLYTYSVVTTLMNKIKHYGLFMIDFTKIIEPFSYELFGQIALLCLRILIDSGDNKLIMQICKNDENEHNLDMDSSVADGTTLYIMNKNESSAISNVTNLFDEDHFNLDLINENHFIMSTIENCYGLSFMFNHIVIDDNAIIDRSIDLFLQLFDILKCSKRRIESDIYLSKNHFNVFVKYFSDEICESNDIKTITTFIKNPSSPITKLPRLSQIKRKYDD